MDRMGSTARILIADGQTKVRFGLRVLLERQAGIEVAGEAVDADTLLAQVSGACPELILLAWDLPGAPVGQTLVDLRASCPGVLLIALSARPEARQEALAAGADAFVSKTAPPEQLLGAITALLAAGRSQDGVTRQ